MSERLRPGEVGRPSTKKTATGSWRSRIRYSHPDGSTAQTSATGPTRAAAEERVVAKARQLAIGDSPSAVPVSRPTVGDVADDWWVRFLKTGPAVGTQTTYRSVLFAHLIPVFGGMDVATTTVPDLNAALESWEESTGFSSHTLRVLLKHTFAYAVSTGLVDRNPMDGVSPQRTPKKRGGDRDDRLKRSLTVDDLNALRDAVAEWGAGHHSRDAVTLRDVVDLWAGTGLRIGEALALRPCDLGGVPAQPGVPLTVEVCGKVQDAPDQGVIREPFPKSNDSFRVVVAPEWLRPMLERRVEQAAGLDAPLFPTSTGRWRSRSNMRRALRSARALAGLDWVTPHSLRRTVATFVEEELGLGNASRQLGHRDERTTRVHYVDRAPLAPDNTAALEALAPRDVEQDSPDEEG